MKFVIGVPRSGTTFFSHLLNIVGPVSIHEHLLSLSGFQILHAAREFCEGKKTKDQIRHLVRCYDMRPEVEIDCNYVLTHILPVILEEYPESRFIHLTRDPRDNVRSCINQLDAYGDFFANPKTQSPLIKWFVTQNKPWLFQVVKAICETFPELDFPNWKNLSQLEKNCIYWAESHRIILDRLSPLKNYMHVRLEDLKDSVDVTKGIFEFLSLPAPRPEKLQKVLFQSVNSNHDPMWSEFNRVKAACGIKLLPKFHEWEQSDQRTLMKHCSGIAFRLGYKLD